jgi:hypothetical protein
LLVLLVPHRKRQHSFLRVLAALVQEVLHAEPNVCGHQVDVVPLLLERARAADHQEGDREIFPFLDDADEGLAFGVEKQISPLRRVDAFCQSPGLLANSQNVLRAHLGLLFSKRSGSSSGL